MYFQQVLMLSINRMNAVGDLQVVYSCLIELIFYDRCIFVLT